MKNRKNKMDTTQDDDEEITEFENLTPNDKQKKEPQQELSNLPLVGFIQKLFLQYNKMFVILLGFQYFNQGSKAMMSLGQKDLFKTYLKLEPDQMQYLESIAGIPWSLKLFLGLMSDNIPICGYKRKSYVIILGFLQFVSLMSVFIFEFESPKMVTAMLFLASLSGAFLDVIVDALMVTQSRLDSEDGSEQLQSLSWGAMGVGGIFGSLFGGYLTEYFHPKWSFFVYSLFGLVVMILGLFQTEINEKQKDKKTFIQEVIFNLKSIKNALKMREARNVIIFLILNGLFSPSFGNFSYYFQMEVVKFSKFQYAMFNVLGYGCLSLGTICYNLYLKETEIRTLFKWACYLGVISSLVNYIFAMRWNLAVGISDTALIVCSDIVLGTLGLAFTNLPMMVLFAKITPDNIEATFFAFLTGTSNFCNGIISPNVGSYLNRFVGVTSKDLSKYYVLMAISSVTSIIPFAFLWLIPLKSEIKVNNEGKNQNEEKDEKEEIELIE